MTIREVIWLLNWRYPAATDRIKRTFESYTWVYSLNYSSHVSTFLSALLQITAVVSMQPLQPQENAIFTRTFTKKGCWDKFTFVNTIAVSLNPDSRLYQCGKRLSLPIYKHWSYKKFLRSVKSRKFCPPWNIDLDFLQINETRLYTKLT